MDFKDYFTVMSFIVRLVLTLTVTTVNIMNLCPTYVQIIFVIVGLEQDSYIKELSQATLWEVNAPRFVNM